jgi:hypothetical protein
LGDAKKGSFYVRINSVERFTNKDAAERAGLQNYDTNVSAL